MVAIEGEYYMWFTDKVMPPEKRYLRISTATFFSHYGEVLLSADDFTVAKCSLTCFLNFHNHPVREAEGGSSGINLGRLWFPHAVLEMEMPPYPLLPPHHQIKSVQLTGFMPSFFPDVVHAWQG